MASGKKVKKSKGKTLNLNDFLADETTAPIPGQAVIMAPRKITSWADEVENDDDSGMYQSSKERVVLPTAPRAARGNDVDEDRVPHHPPFLAYMSNLPYDLEEDDLIQFFGKLKIVKVRLPKDDRESGRLKGFGYVEFEERADLKEALGMTDTSLKNRRVRIEVSDNDGRRGGMGGRDRDNTERPLTDWRSGPRDDGRAGEDRGGNRREYGGGGFGRDREGGREGDREGGREGGRGGFGGDRAERPAGPWERNRGGPEPERQRSSFGGGGERGFDRDRGFGGDRDRDRGGFGGDRRGGGGFGNDRYEGRSNFGGGGGDRYGDRRGEGGGGGGGGMSNFQRSERRPYEPRGGGEDSGSRYSRDDRPSDRGGEANEESDAPKERPKLNLAPRTKPVEEGGSEDTGTSAPAPAPASSSSIFGGARPVDTMTRELEIEERLAKQRAAPKEGEGEGGASEGAPAAAPAKSWRTERQQQPPPQQRATSKEDRRGDDAPRRGDSSEGRYQPPRDSGANSESRYQPPRGSYQQRQGHSPSDRRGDAPRGDAPRPAPQRAGPGNRAEDRPSRTEKPRRDVNDDAIRMPKFEENQAPDFIGSNPYAALPDEVDPDVECD